MKKTRLQQLIDALLYQTELVKKLQIETDYNAGFVAGIIAAIKLIECLINEVETTEKETL